MSADSGFWNRAGRRSGGYRPTEIVIPTVVTCGGCQTTTPFGLLPTRLIALETEIKCCPKCGGVLLAHDKDRGWLTASEFMAVVPSPTDETRGTP